METIEKIVPDTSVIIEGILSKKISAKELSTSNIIIHEAVVAELEHQANANKTTGHIGLEEIQRLQELSKNNFTIEFAGKKPTSYEAEHGKQGDIDYLIRHLAFESDAMLITADKVQAKVAQAKGINHMLIKIEAKKRKLLLEKYFDDTTMSVHMKEGTPVFAKKGRPGAWEFAQITKNKITDTDIIKMADEIVEEATISKNSFVEIERFGSTIAQIGRYRIVIVKPPFSDGWEITAVRPVKILNIDDYKLSDKLRERIEEQAEGILIAGAPGNGKSTFAQALAEFYAKNDKIIKTVEAPRDLQLSEGITQYAISHGSSQEVHDILLLSRPDYTIFDEMRNTDDFMLFTDMRLSGVGMIGVVHGTNPVDSIQRFIGRIELGVIPQIIDTVLFIKDGEVAKVLSLGMEVKVPSGMTEADLARPIVTIKDFETNKLEYEIYTYGEQTVVIPVQAGTSQNPAQALAGKEIERFFKQYTDEISVEMVSNNRCNVFVPQSLVPEIIGKGGKNIESIEKKLGISLNIEALGRPAKRGKDKEPVDFGFNIKKNSINLMLDPALSHQDVDVMLDGDFLLTAKVSKRGIVKVKKNNKIGKIIINALNAGENLELRA